ncbi:MAG: hypothetical protein O7F71_11220 [Gammaproteobacteria bacterium]|nr:hypothetical protein [Gammaproteobacteria bacterium]
MGATEEDAFVVEEDVFEAEEDVFEVEADAFRTEEDVFKPEGTVFPGSRRCSRHVDATWDNRQRRIVERNWLGYSNFHPLLR